MSAPEQSKIYYFTNEQKPGGRTQQAQFYKAILSEEENRNPWNIH